MSGLPFLVQASVGVQAAIAIALLVLLFISIAFVRRDHPSHVHTLWYLFSLTLCTTSLLFLLIYRHVITDSAFGGWPATIGSVFLDMSMDVRGEVYTLAGFAMLLILPQFLSYCISGLFGCGSPPVFVSTVTRIAAWSLIKFFAILSGILAAQSIFALYGRPFYTPMQSLYKCNEALLIMSLSFISMSLYYKFIPFYEAITDNRHMRFLGRTFRYMTRYSKESGRPR